MQQGTIKTLTDKGFGFITRKGEAKDLFFHSSQLTNCAYNDLRQGDTLEFNVEVGEKGPHATEIRLVGETGK